MAPQLTSGCGYNGSEKGTDEVRIRRVVQWQGSQLYKFLWKNIPLYLHFPSPRVLSHNTRAIRSPKTAGPRPSPLLSLSHLSGLKEAHNFWGREGPGVGNITAISSYQIQFLSGVDLQKAVLINTLCVCTQKGTEITYCLWGGLKDRNDKEHLNHFNFFFIMSMLYLVKSKYASKFEKQKEMPCSREPFIAGLTSMKLSEKYKTAHN